MTETTRGYDANELRDAIQEVVEEFGGNREVLICHHDGTQSFVFTVFDVSYDDGYVIVHAQKKFL